VLAVLAIAVGGAVGAVGRFYLSTGVYSLIGRDFPYGTLAVNVLGSVAMGLLYALALERFPLTPELRAGLLVGLLGAFTTFSTFSIETLQLMEDGEQLKASLNALLSVVLCVAGCWVGVVLGRQV
jgi:CrcB protein